MISGYLKCRDCDEAFHFPVNGLYYAASAVLCSQAERDDWPSSIFGGPYEVLTREIWCGVCNRPSFAERIPTEREFENAVGLVRRKNSPFGMRSATDEPDDPLLELDAPSLLFLAQGLAGRKAPGGCLWCGGHSYMPLSGRPLSGGEEEISHLRHEGCGGTFEFMRPMWCLGAYIPSRRQLKDGDGEEPRWYDFEGNFLVQSYYPFEAHDAQAE